MNIQEHTTPERLEKYSFFWSEARLIIAAIALIWGATPPLYRILGPIGLSGLAYNLLTIAWIISGAVSLYLLFRWNKAGKKVFGGSDKKDMIAFFVNIVSGINLGITGLLSQNIGMSIAKGSTILFIITGIIYLAAAWHLFQRWNAHGKKVF